MLIQLDTSINLQITNTAIIVDATSNSAQIGAYFSVQLIAICAVVKSKCALENGTVCTKKCRDSGQNDDL